MEILVAGLDAGASYALNVALKHAGRSAQNLPSAGDALEQLQQVETPVLLLLDWRLAAPSPAQSVRRIRTLKRRAYTYILAVTNSNDPTEAEGAIQAGADDFLAIHGAAQQLPARILVAEQVVALRQSFSQMQEAYAFESTHDALTGVHNRRGILHALRAELDRGVRQNSPTALAFGDVDHFKLINDRHGHTAGDAVLRGIAERIQRGVRIYDSVGRYGGEEFLVVLPGCNRTQAAALTDRLRRAVESTHIEVGDRSVHATISFGVAGTDVNSSSAEALISAADAALYHAKKSGRNRVYPRPEPAAEPLGPDADERELAPPQKRPAHGSAGQPVDRGF